MIWRWARRCVDLMVAFGVVAPMVVLAEAPQVPEPLRVVTYNIRGDFSQGKVTSETNAWQHKEGPDRRDLLLNEVRNLDADLLAVQEAYDNQVQELSEALPEFDSYGVGRDDGESAGEHCKIYWRRKLFRKTDQGTFWLSETPEQPGSMCLDAACTRISSWVVLEPTDEFASSGWQQPLLVMNMHWDHVSQPARLFAAELVRDRMSKLAAGERHRLARVMLGDYNAALESSELVLLRKGRKDEGRVDLPTFVDVYRSLHEPSERERTHHGFQGHEAGHSIDHVFIDGSLTPVSAEIVRTEKDGRYPSDHYPVVVELLPTSAHPSSSGER